MLGDGLLMLWKFVEWPQALRMSPRTAMLTAKVVSASLVSLSQLVILLRY